MTEEEARLAASTARESMMFELTHPGKRCYDEMAQVVEQKVFDTMMDKEGSDGDSRLLRPLSEGQGLAQAVSEGDN